MWKSFLMGLSLMYCLQADEGMWPFHGIPKEKIYEKYGVKLEDEWIESVQKACLRISAGGSGSFISSKGLVMTNHHVGASAIYHLSSNGCNYMDEGFYAKTQDLELLCPNLYFDQLITTSDVTDEVNANIEEAMSFAEREEMKKANIAGIQKRAKESSGLQPEIVMLYQGARYHLYLYQRYTDIRLVMAPEKSAAFLGGDIDNFEYPRYNLDVCFFRVYNDQGSPLETKNYLKWSDLGPQEEELLFIAGNPGKTRRMVTADHLQFLQEIEIPILLEYLEERKQMLETFSLKNQENKRIALQLKSSICNARKVYKGIEKELQPSSLIDKKEKEDSFFYKTQESETYLPWLELKHAFSKVKSLIAPHFVLEGVGSAHCKLYDLARSLVRLSQEMNKPNDERLPEYVDTEMSKISLKILSKEPFYEDFEIACLVDGLQRVKKTLGEEHPLIQTLFAGRSELELASFLLKTTDLDQIETRERLYANLQEIETSTDPLIVFAKEVDLVARAIRKQKEDELDGLQNECYARIAKHKLDKFKDQMYPDATFSLRLSLGQMKGYQEEEKFLNPMTTLSGMLQHAKEHGRQEPYFLLDRWINAENDMDKNAPLNFVSTHDIVGGNSGSPVFNAKAQWVGVVFDGNRHTLNWSHVFDDQQGRSVSVHCLGIIEALKHVYHADSLVEEIRGF